MASLPPPPSADERLPLIIAYTYTYNEARKRTLAKRAELATAEMDEMAAYHALCMSHQPVPAAAAAAAAAIDPTLDALGKTVTSALVAYTAACERVTEAMQDLDQASADADRALCRLPDAKRARKRTSDAALEAALGTHTRQYRDAQDAQRCAETTRVVLCDAQIALARAQMLHDVSA